MGAADRYGRHAYGSGQARYAAGFVAGNYSAARRLLSLFDGRSGDDPTVALCQMDSQFDADLADSGLALSAGTCAGGPAGRAQRMVRGGGAGRILPILLRRLLHAAKVRARDCD